LPDVTAARECVFINAYEICCVRFREVLIILRRFQLKLSRKFKVSVNKTWKELPVMVYKEDYELIGNNYIYKEEEEEPIEN
jgi:hypothetical protein